MKRYSSPQSLGLSLAEDPEGRWVKYADVQDLILSLAILERESVVLWRHLHNIAGVPVSLPNANAAIKYAREVVDGRQ